MNLAEEILREHSKRQVRKIANWVGSDKKRLKQLMELFLSDYSRSQCTALQARSRAILRELVRK